MTRECWPEGRPDDQRSQWLSRGGWRRGGGGGGGGGVSLPLLGQAWYGMLTLVHNIASERDHDEEEGVLELWCWKCC
jgi:hypothetical protein